MTPIDPATVLLVYFSAIVVLAGVASWALEHLARRRR